MATFQELSTDIMDRLNLTSEDAASRVMKTLHTRYKRVTSSIGLIPSRRTRVSNTATIGSRDLTFSSIEKVDVVYRIVGTKTIKLDEITSDEMVDEPLKTEPVTKYCIRSMTDTTVTIRMNVTPTTAFTLYAEGLASQSRIAPDASPAFPESFHDVLIYGVLADEYRKKEQFEFMRAAEEDYENRLSDLRMFIAKSAYLNLYQGKTSNEAVGWWDTGSKT